MSDKPVQLEFVLGIEVLPGTAEPKGRHVWRHVCRGPSCAEPDLVDPVERDGPVELIDRALLVIACLLEIELIWLAKELSIPTTSAADLIQQMIKRDWLRPVVLPSGRMTGRFRVTGIARALMKMRMGV